MFKNAIIYTIRRSNPLPPLADIEAALQGMQFAPCAPTQSSSSGFVPPRGEKHGALAESVGGHIIVRMCTETKSVPAAVVKRHLNERLDRVEAETGRRPKGKRAKELKEEIIHELLPQAFPKRGTVTAWIDPNRNHLVVDAGSLSKADEVAAALAHAHGGDVVFAPLQTATSPTSAMSDWLVSQDAPAGSSGDFTIDRECELKQPDSEKAAVRYSRHTLEIEEIAEHIRQGKQPVSLAMTHAGRVSFVLTESGALKKLVLLDVVFEAGADDSAGGFDADVAIFTGEMRNVIADLVDALGGPASIESTQHP